jgi:hypothetical protein
MSTLGSTGLIKSADNSLVIDINEKYFPDSSYNFFIYKTIVAFSQHTTTFNQVFDITSGLWYIFLSATFLDSPACSAGITSNVFNGVNYGVNTDLYTLPYLSLPSGYNFMSWNAVAGFGNGSKNGVSTSCIINVPLSYPGAYIGAVVYSQTTSPPDTPNVTVIMTATRIGPPQPA